MLYLHIGSQKTGSSSIQHMLRDNTEALAEQGFHYVNAGRDNQKRLRIHHNRIAALLKEGTAAPTFSRLVAEVEASRCENFIISAELLSSPGLGRSLSEHIPQHLKDKTKVIIYLRRPDLYLESLYKQRVKSGKIRSDPTQFYKSYPTSMDYLTIIDDYANTFGKNSIEVRIYERQSLINGDAIDDFFNVIGLSDLANFSRPKPEANSSFSRAFSEMSGQAVRHLGINFPKITDTATKLKPQGIKRSKDVYTLDERRRVVADHVEGLETIRRRFRADLAQLFSVDDLKVDDDPFPSADEQIALYRSASEAIFEILADIKGNA